MKAARSNGTMLTAEHRSNLRGTVRARRDEQHRASTTALIAERKERQRTKIKELGTALAESGFTALDQQALVLGLSRSTTWSILRAGHKTSGLSAAILNRMWASPQLPRPVRLKIIEYVEEKNAGLYGDSRAKCRKFRTRLSEDLIRYSPEAR